MSSSSITAIRQELRVTLGTNYTRYMVVMREWFSDRHNKLDWEFDMPFLTGRAKELHNRLMLAILQHCMSPKFQERKASPIQTHILFPTTGNGASTKNVMTLHAAPEQEEMSLTYHIDVPTTAPAPPPNPPPPLAVSLSISEEDAEVEEDVAEDAKVQPLFVVGLRKARRDELNERPPHSRNKTDWRTAPGFLNEFLETGYPGNRDIIPNITHGISAKKYLDPEPDLRQYFPAWRNGEGDLFCSTDATLPGKVLMKAWEYGIRSIDPHVIAIISRAVQDRVRLLIRELIKERKTFRLKANGQVQFGEYHVNPYLLSRHHIPTSSNAERRPYSTILVDPITLPPDAELQDKNEQMAALMAAASMDSPFRPPRKISAMEVYLLLKANPHLNVGGVEGQRLIEKLLIVGSGSLEPSAPPDDTEDGFEEGELLPIVSY